jgi:Ca2+-binding EF-hand superfamily protein
MKTSTKVMLAVGAIALGTTTMVGVGLADGKGGRGYHGAGHHGGGPGWHSGRMERLFEQFDTNQDGVVTQVEIDEVRSSRLAEFDADGDGSLTLEEYQALWLDAMRERMVDQFQAHDDDGDGLVTVEEFGERYDSMVGRLDRNDDGEITQDDLRRRPRDRDRGGNDG